MTGRPRGKARAALAVGAAAIGLVAASTAAGGPPLRRSLDSYVVFAIERASLKNFQVLNACNIGVNCKTPAGKSSCGRFTGSPKFLDSGQLAADRTFHPKPGCVLDQLFRNGGGSLSSCVIKDPPVNPLVAPPGEDLAPPGPGECSRILPDIDGDGVASCGCNCDPDIDDIKMACGFPMPFPACDLTKPVQVRPGADCLGAPDTDPGNGQCDLGPGTYGAVIVKDLSILELDGGTYDVCSFSAGKNAIVTSVTPSVINIASPGFFRVGNGATLGQHCGDIAVNLEGSGPSQFGKGARIAAFLCAPDARCALGHGNEFKGRFVCDVVTSDVNNRAECCLGPCACFDSFTPASAHVGDQVKLTSECNLNNAKAVTICGIEAPIVAKAPAELTVVVPSGASGACAVSVLSDAGTFTHVGTLTVM